MEFYTRVENKLLSELKEILTLSQYGFILVEIDDGINIYRQKRG